MHPNIAGRNFKASPTANIQSIDNPSRQIKIIVRLICMAWNFLQFFVSVKAQSENYLWYFIHGKNCPGG